jgi:protein TonB
MSKLSIFETRWIDLVFEDRNKDYGAYQLRKESPKTTIISLFLALFFVLVVVSFPAAIQYFYGISPKPIAEEQSILGPSVYFQKPPIPEKKSVLPPAKNEQKAQKTKPNLTKSIVTKNPLEAIEIPKNIDLPNNTTSKNNSLTESEGESLNSKLGITASNIPANNPPAILNSYELDKNPAFPGGIGKFLNYVGRNFKTPEIELEKTIKIDVSFIVEIDGSMSNIIVKRDPGYGLAEEAIRVLKSLKTKWVPGIKEGKSVRTFYNLPITVELK